MAKTHITRTFGPIHFEDLDPHRFEDLVRELIYDFKDWQSIEATGRGGADDGFDIRAYEKTFSNANNNDEDENENDAQVTVMDGNLWMVQCKREAEIGPTKVSSIIKSGINPNCPPYGYILVASANFTKKSYDTFRSELKKMGVMEFYLWGKAQLEDMLHMPKFDRILFTFFGISLLTIKKNKTTEVRLRINNKNKLIRILGSENGVIDKPVLLRDIKDTEYPFNDKYVDFKNNPRWLSVIAEQFSANGMWVKYHEYFGYVDNINKEFSYTTEVDLLYAPNMITDEEKRDLNNNKKENVENYWEYFSKWNQAKIIRWGSILFDDIVLIDDKGDVIYDFPHIYTDFKASNGAFNRLIDFIQIGDKQIEIKSDEYKKIEVFPKKFPDVTIGKVYEDKKIKLTRDIISNLNNGQSQVGIYYDFDNKYDFLQPKDVIAVESEKLDADISYVKLTTKYHIKVGEYVKKSATDYIKSIIERQTGKHPNDDESLNVYEFREIYEWQIKRFKLDVEK